MQSQQSKAKHSFVLTILLWLEALTRELRRQTTELLLDKVVTGFGPNQGIVQGYRTNIVDHTKELFRNERNTQILPYSCGGGGLKTPHIPKTKYIPATFCGNTLLDCQNSQLVVHGRRAYGFQNLVWTRVQGGHNLPPLVEIGLRQMPKLGVDVSPRPHAHRLAWVNKTLIQSLDEVPISFKFHTYLLKYGFLFFPGYKKIRRLC